MKPFVLIFVVAALTSSALAQTNRRQKRQAAKPVAAPVTAAPVSTAPAATPAPAPAAPPQFLQIRYFGEFLGSNLYRWDDKLTDVDGKRNTNSKRNYFDGADPTQWFHQFSFRMLVADNVRLIIEPRFITQVGGRNKMGGADDKQLVQQADHRVGFLSNYWNSDDKVWSTTYRLSARLPTSRADKNSGHILQFDPTHITSYKLSEKVSFGLYNTYRYYWYESSKDAQRWRLYTSPSVTYTIDDVWSIFVSYEHEYSHRSNASAPTNNATGENVGSERRRSFFNAHETLQDVYAGVNYNINPSLTFYPFIRFAQVSKWDTQTMQAGFWLMGAIY